MATSTIPARTGNAGPSSILLKITMATSGLLFVFYALMHMYGNLKAFWGQATFDEYAHHLRTLGQPILPYGGFLWLFRLLLIAALVAHVWSASTLWGRANRARSERYAVKKAVAASTSSKWMRWGGVTLLLFVIFHLIQFTIAKVNFNGNYSDSQLRVNGVESPYLLLHASFQLWWVVLIYLIALVALAMHLHHGVWSASQTLGWTNSPAARARAKALGVLIALVVAVGFALVPLAIVFGIIGK